MSFVVLFFKVCMYMLKMRKGESGGEGGRDKGSYVEGW